MADTAEVDRWMAGVHCHLGAVIQAVEMASCDPVGAQDSVVRAGEEALRWLVMDPGPWPDVSDVLKAIVHSCIGYGVTAADVVTRMNDPDHREPVDTRRLHALGERMLAEVEMLGQAGRRHGLGSTRR